MKLTDFNEFLRKLEYADIRIDLIKKLDRLMVEDHIYRPLFDNYVRTRLLKNVHPERLLTLAYNVEKSTKEQTKELSLVINKIVAANVTTRKDNFDQLYFMFRHDQRITNHIRNEFCRQLGYLNSDDMNSTITKIVPHINVDRITLILWTIENRGSDALAFRRLYLMEGLPTEDQYNVLIKCLEQNNSSFPHIIRSIEATPLNQMIIDNLSTNGDNDPLALAIQKSTLDITMFASASSLNNTLLLIEDKVPNTLNVLFKRAEAAQQWDYVMALGYNKNKKELLRSIVKSKDKDLIDRFFRLYKNSPEVKHLTPFL